MGEEIESKTRARRGDVATSHAAAETLDATAQVAKIFMALRVLPDESGTFHEIAAMSGLFAEQVHRRLPEMMRLAMVYRLPESITRKGPSGRECRVWKLRRKKA